MMGKREMCFCVIFNQREKGKTNQGLKLTWHECTLHASCIIILMDNELLHSIQQGFASASTPYIYDHNYADSIQSIQLFHQLFLARLLATVCNFEDN